MAGCAFIKPDGGRCKAGAMEGYQCRTLDGPTFAGVVVAREKVFDREDL